jgi:hypothetical protein
MSYDYIADGIAIVHCSIVYLYVRDMHKYTETRTVFCMFYTFIPICMVLGLVFYPDRSIHTIERRSIW